MGQIIAVLAEEGDDLSSVEVPSNLAPEGEASSSASSTEKPAEAESKAQSAPTPTPTPEPASAPKSHGHKNIKHSKPLFPSVSRLSVHHT